MHSVVAKAQELFEVYRGIQGDTTLPMVDDLDLSVIAQTVANMSGHKIRIKAAPNPNNTGGAIFRRIDSSEIYIHARLNPCWRRFIICKELSHLALDSESSFINSPQDMSNLIMRFFANGCSHKTQADASETKAIICAMFILMPQHCDAIYGQMLGSNASIRDVATKYRVPQMIVEARYYPEFLSELDLD